MCPLMLAPMRDYTRWKKTVYPYDSLNAFLACRQFADGIHAIQLGTAAKPKVLDILVNKAGHKQALVFFNAAADRNHARNLPIFSGVGVSKDLDVTLISVSDASLDDDPTLGLAWYCGSRDVPLQKILPDVLQHLLRSLGCARSVLYGGSGGGFAALLYARTLPHALPIAVNPQTQISKYSASFVRNFAVTCYGWDGSGDAGDFLSRHIVEKLSSLYRLGNSPFVLVQNLSDDHVDDHTLPFMQDLLPQGETARVESGPIGSGMVFFRQWGDGHAPLPGESVTFLLQQILQHQGSWNRLPARLTLPDTLTPTLPGASEA